MYKRYLCLFCDKKWWSGGKYTKPSCPNPFCEINYRVLRKFTYNGQPKKDPPSVSRWKTKKQGQFSSGWWCGNTAKKNFKHYTNRKHRAWQRRMLAEERYDEFFDRAWKYAENWWNWD